VNFVCNVSELVRQLRMKLQQNRRNNIEAYLLVWPIRSEGRFCSQSEMWILRSDSSKYVLAASMVFVWQPEKEPHVIAWWSLSQRCVLRSQRLQQAHGHSVQSQPNVKASQCPTSWQESRSCRSPEHPQSPTPRESLKYEITALSSSKYSHWDEVPERGWNSIVRLVLLRWSEGSFTSCSIVITNCVCEIKL
jgi:hypothetical protein